MKFSFLFTSLVLAQSKTTVVLLVHGILGGKQDFTHYQQAIVNTIESLPILQSNDKLLVLNPDVNAGLKSFDGIENGAQRLYDYLDEETKNIQGLITLVIAAHSLGGVYSRKLIAKLNAKRFIFDTFLTLSTPHLGSREHLDTLWLTYLPYSLASAFPQTLRDLTMKDGETWEDSLLYKMATEEEYLAPLGKFKRHILYGVVNGMDITVGYATATIQAQNVFDLMPRGYDQDKLVTTQDELVSNIKNYVNSTEVDLFMNEPSKNEINRKMIESLTKNIKWERFAVYLERLFFAHEDVVQKYPRVKEDELTEHVVKNLLKLVAPPLGMVEVAKNAWKPRRKPPTPTAIMPKRISRDSMDVKGSQQVKSPARRIVLSRTQPIRQTALNPGKGIRNVLSTPNVARLRAVI